jgi:hypothetical protein
MVDNPSGGPGTSIIHVKKGDCFKFMVGETQSMEKTVVEYNFCALKIFATSDYDLLARLPLIMDVECYPPPKKHTKIT